MYLHLWTKLLFVFLYCTINITFKKKMCWLFYIDHNFSKIYTFTHFSLVSFSNYTIIFNKYLVFKYIAGLNIGRKEKLRRGVQCSLAYHGISPNLFKQGLHLKSTLNKVSELCILNVIFRDLFLFTLFVGNLILYLF